MDLAINLFQISFYSHQKIEFPKFRTNPKSTIEGNVCNETDKEIVKSLEIGFIEKSFHVHQVTSPFFCCVFCLFVFVPKVDDTYRLISV